MQIKLLKIMGLVGAGDRQASENMYNVILDSMRRANSSHTIGNAIIIECIRTITVIYPQPNLLQAGSKYSLPSSLSCVFDSDYSAIIWHRSSLGFLWHMTEFSRYITYRSLFDFVCVSPKLLQHRDVILASICRFALSVVLDIHMISSFEYAYVWRD